MKIIIILIWLALLASGIYLIYYGVNEGSDENIIAGVCMLLFDIFILVRLRTEQYEYELDLVYIA